MKYIEKINEQRRILDRPVKPDDDRGGVARKISHTLLPTHAMHDLLDFSLWRDEGIESPDTLDVLSGQGF